MLDGDVPHIEISSYLEYASMLDYLSLADVVNGRGARRGLQVLEVVLLISKDTRLDNRMSSSNSLAAIVPSVREYDRRSYTSCLAIAASAHTPSASLRSAGGSHPEMALISFQVDLLGHAGQVAPPPSPMPSPSSISSISAVLALMACSSQHLFAHFAPELDKAVFAKHGIKLGAGLRFPSAVPCFPPRFERVKVGVEPQADDNRVLDHVRVHGRERCVERRRVLREQ